MRFKAGRFGTCAVVLALLGTVLMGFVLSVDKDTVAVTNYNYITDVSGLFSYSDSPEYVDYNPSTNFVGYTAGTTTPKYETNPTANNYRYVVNAGTSEHLTDIAITTSNGSDDYGTPTPAGELRYMGAWWNGTADYGPTGINPTFAFIHGATKLSTILAGVDLTGVAQLTIEITNDDFPVFVYGGSWEYTRQYLGYPISKWSNEYRATFNENNAVPDELVITTVDMSVTAYRGGASLWTNTADNVAVFTHVTQAQLNTVETIDSTFAIYATSNATYGYMNPNAGVTLTGTGYIDWTNGYDCNEVTIKVVKPSNNATISLTVNGSLFTVGWESGTLKVWSGGDVVLTLGDWLGVQIRLDGSTGAVYFTPLYFDLSLITVADETAYTAVVDDLITVGDISSIRFGNDNAGTYPHWQVVATTVFLNTYNTIMIAPAINIRAYFPELDDYRLNFYAFAIYGDSMTVNGVTGTVDPDNATITFEVNGVTYTNKMTNLYVSEDDTHTYVSFANTNTIIDLGVTSDSTITFGGSWFFTTGLYEPYDSWQTVYNWDLDGGFHATAGQCLIIFFAILGGAVLVGRYAVVTVHVLDWFVIVFAGFFAYVYFGGLIV